MGLEKKHPAGWATGGAQDRSVARLNVSEHSPQSADLQALLGKATRHRWAPEALGAVLSLRHDRADCTLLAIGGLMALDPEDREAVAETVLDDLEYPVAAQREAARMRRQWIAHCSDPTRRLRR